ncbi:MAG: hypothetical protein ABIF40_05165 [archaeon]
MKSTISKDIPLAEITLRRYEKPYEMPRRELIRKVCLSVGLLQPGDSRDVVVDVFQALLDAKEELSSEQVKAKVVKLRENEKLPIKGIASSNIRRQLKRLRDLYLIEKIKNNYRMTEFEDVSVLFEKKIEKYYLHSILERVREYFEVLK